MDQSSHWIIRTGHPESNNWTFLEGHRFWGFPNAGNQYQDFQTRINAGQMIYVWFLHRAPQHRTFAKTGRIIRIVNHFPRPDNIPLEVYNHLQNHYTSWFEWESIEVPFDTINTQNYRQLRSLQLIQGETLNQRLIFPQMQDMVANELPGDQILGNIIPQPEVNHNAVQLDILQQDYIDAESERAQPNGPGSIYVVRMTGTQWVKIGMANNVQIRLATLQTASPALLIVFRERAFNQMKFLYKQRLHTRLAAWRTLGEWFCLGPNQDHTANLDLGQIGNLLDNIEFEEVSYE